MGPMDRHLSKRSPGSGPTRSSWHRSECMRSDFGFGEKSSVILGRNRVRSKPNSLMQSRSCSNRSAAAGRRNSLTNFPEMNFARLSIEQQTIKLPRLPQTLKGLKVAHLSDFHFTGDLAEEFFDYVIQRVNAWQPELVVLTGDYLDHKDCLPWLTRVFAELSDPSRVFYVLGNHDSKRGLQREINRALQAAGIVDVGGGPWRIVNVRNTPILLAGNEEPWLGPAAAIYHSRRNMPSMAATYFESCSRTHQTELMRPWPPISTSCSPATFTAGRFRCRSLGQSSPRALTGYACNAARSVARTPCSTSAAASRRTCRSAGVRAPRSVC
jgi:hypothetical protein